MSQMDWKSVPPPLSEAYMKSYRSQTQRACEGMMVTGGEHHGTLQSLHSGETGIDIMRRMLAGAAD
ncbi:hypothetical protein KCP70_02525 [Salmonella enterica subsp. enterica]|nr:hypothetical protein KCP70_02525 [Salmonella enterica subsp. enterica]